MLGLTGRVIRIEDGGALALFDNPKTGLPDNAPTFIPENERYDFAFELI